MDDWVCIYTGNRLAAHSLAGALERAGVPVFERDEEHAAALAEARAPATRVLVPPEERARALGVATHWQTHQVERVQTVTGRLARVFALSLLAPAAWWGGALALPERVPAPTPHTTGAVWLAGFVATAQLESRRHRRERIVLEGPFG